jgi:protein involved in polysaccharide export with SLBB domain
MRSLCKDRIFRRFAVVQNRGLFVWFQGAALCVLLIAFALLTFSNGARAQTNGLDQPSGSSSDFSQPSGNSLSGLESAAVGGPTDQEIAKLCQGVRAKQMSSDEIDSVASALGLSEEQVAQLKKCASEPWAQTSPATGSEMSAMPSVQKRAPEVSSIETRFRELETPYKLFTPPSSSKLKQFGYDLFSSPVSTFAPLLNVPVSDDYVLGPGDQLNVLLWGRVNRTLSLKVQRDGTILMPQMGPIQVSGLTFAQAKKVIESQAGQITGVQVSVTMGQVRAIQVFVIGKVNQPGVYTVSALSHVSNALVAAGGISKMGSLRRIELRRGNSVVSRIDLYNMLLKGDTSADVRLRSRDVIFVPVIGPVVAVTGDVKSPAIYELKGNQDLADVLQMAGGVSAFGYSERLQLERVQNHQRRIVLDVNLNHKGASQFAVDDGDLIKVFSVLPRQRNVVIVKGNVNQPGSYEWHPGMRIADLVREAQGTAPHTFMDYALIRRRDKIEHKTALLPVNLGDALSAQSGPDDFALRPEDTLTVYANNELGQVPTVSVVGEVRKPGKYPLISGMTVRELVYEAGGLKDDASHDRAELARMENQDGRLMRYAHMDIALAQALDGSYGQDVPLKSGDEVYIQQASNWHKPWHVIVDGQVMRPGPYPIFQGERLASVLRAAGGFRRDAYLPAAVFLRESVKKLQQEQLDQARARLKQDITRVALMPRQPGQPENTAEMLSVMQNVLSQSESQRAMGRVVIHLASLDILQNSPDNVLLEDGDKLVIPSRPASVQVLGQVYNPNAIVYQPELTVRNYLQRAGGPTQGADTDHIYVIKADGSILTNESVLDSGKNRIFPLLPVISGGLMQNRLAPGDTIYVPEKLIYVSPIRYAQDMTQIVSNGMTSLGVLALLATNL